MSRKYFPKDLTHGEASAIPGSSEDTNVQLITKCNNNSVICQSRKSGRLKYFLMIQSCLVSSG